MFVSQQETLRRAHCRWSSSHAPSRLTPCDVMPRTSAATHTWEGAEEETATPHAHAHAAKKHSGAPHRHTIKTGTHLSDLGGVGGVRSRSHEAADGKVQQVVVLDEDPLGRAHAQGRSRHSCRDSRGRKGRVKDGPVSVKREKCGVPLVKLRLSEC
jgi:hypothetical protein